MSWEHKYERTLERTQTLDAAFDRLDAIIRTLNRPALTAAWTQAVAELNGLARQLRVVVVDAELNRAALYQGRPSEKRLTP